jgi:hypothetical protein
MPEPSGAHSAPAVQMSCTGKTLPQDLSPFPGSNPQILRLLPPGAQTGAALSFSYGKVRCSVPPDNLVAVGCNLLENLVHQIIDLLFENNDQTDQDHNDQYDLDCPHTGLIIPEISYFSSHTRPRFLLFLRCRAPCKFKTRS